MKNLSNCNTTTDENGKPLTWTSSDLYQELAEDRQNGNLDDVRSLFNSINDRNLKLDVLLSLIDNLESAEPTSEEMATAQLARTIMRTLIFNEEK